MRRSSVRNIINDPTDILLFNGMLGKFSNEECFGKVSDNTSMIKIHIGVCRKGGTGQCPNSVKAMFAREKIVQEPNLINTGDRLVIDIMCCKFQIVRIESMLFDKIMIDEEFREPEISRRVRPLMSASKYIEASVLKSPMIIILKLALRASSIWRITKLANGFPKRR